MHLQRSPNMSVTFVIFNVIILSFFIFSKHSDSNVFGANTYDLSDNIKLIILIIFCLVILELDQFGYFFSRVCYNLVCFNIINIC